MALELPRYRFTVDEYMQMGEAGIFTEDDRVELLDGDIVAMSPIGTPHWRCVNRLNMLLAPALVGRAIVSVQNPIRLGTYWEPQPDLTVVRLREDDYATGKPTGKDVLLVIEVADTSRLYDMAKWPAYARAGIPEAWLVDLNADTILAHRAPSDEAYRVVQPYRRGDAIPLLAFPDISFQVGDILP
jgi:Uma2 family endonuclease